MKKLSITTIVILTISFSLSGCSGADVGQGMWILDSFGGESTPVDSVADATSQFTLSEGTVTGNGGVNTFNGTYELSGNDITFSPLVSTRMAGPPEHMEQEMRFFEALESAAQIEVRNEKLTLSDAENNVLMLMLPHLER